MKYIFNYLTILVSLILNFSYAEVDWKKEQTIGSLEFVKLGYGDLKNKSYRSLNFVTECLETDQIIKIIPVVEQYNSFEGAKVAEAIKQFRGQVGCYEFGRAGSPVLHINIPYWTHQKEYYNGSKQGKRITDKEVEKLIEQLQMVFQGTLYADEFGKDSIMERKVYFWWD